MTTEITQGVSSARLEEIAKVCREIGVERLELFGSAASGELKPDSDIDVLVTFSPGARDRGFDAFFTLRERLQVIFNRPVDLVTARSLRNPHLIREIESRRQLLYAA